MAFRKSSWKVILAYGQLILDMVILVPLTFGVYVWVEMNLRILEQLQLEFSAAKDESFTIFTKPFLEMLIVIGTVIFVIFTTSVSALIMGLLKRNVFLLKVWTILQVILLTILTLIWATCVCFFGCLSLHVLVTSFIISNRLVAIILVGMACENIFKNSRNRKTAILNGVHVNYLS